jgi:hypothetical protein
MVRPGGRGAPCRGRGFPGRRGVLTLRRPGQRTSFNPAPRRVVLTAAPDRNPGPQARRRPRDHRGGPRRRSAAPTENRTSRSQSLSTLQLYGSSPTSPADARVLLSASAPRREGVRATALVRTFLSSIKAASLRSARRSAPSPRQVADTPRSAASVHRHRRRSAALCAGQAASWISLIMRRSENNASPGRPATADR